MKNNQTKIITKNDYNNKKNNDIINIMIFTYDNKNEEDWGIDCYNQEHRVKIISYT